MAQVQISVQDVPVIHESSRWWQQLSIVLLRRTSSSMRTETNNKQESHHESELLQISVFSFSKKRKETLITLFIGQM